MSDLESGWRCSFRYNGMREGPNKTLTRELPVDATSADCLLVIAELRKDALRANHSIFVNGWSADWFENG